MDHHSFTSKFIRFRISDHSGVGHFALRSALIVTYRLGERLLVSRLKRDPDFIGTLFSRRTATIRRTMAASATWVSAVVKSLQIRTAVAARGPD